MTTWTSDELNKIGKAEELEIASLRRDGTLRKPTTIWIVRVGDGLYVRPVYGRGSAWFRGTQVRHEGHETLDTHTWVVAPWWQWPPFDLFAELLPLRLTDRRVLHYELAETSPADVDPDQLLDRATALRNQLGESRVAPAGD